MKSYSDIEFQSFQMSLYFEVCFYVVLVWLWEAGVFLLCFENVK